MAEAISLSAGEKQRISRRRFWVLGFTVSAVTILLCLVVLELGLRAIGYKVTLLREVGHAQLGLPVLVDYHCPEIFREYSTTTPIVRHYNNMGFLTDRDTPAQPAPGVHRIVVVGDSQTHGACSYWENYPARLGNVLNQRSGRVFEILNGGNGRYSPYQDYMRARLYGLPAHPEQIVVGLYTGNDLVDLVRSDDRPYLLQDANGAFVPEPPTFILYRDPASTLSPIEKLCVYSLFDKTLGEKIRYQYTRARMLLASGKWADPRNPIEVGRYMWRVARLTRLHLNLMTQLVHQYVWFETYPETLPKALAANREVMRLFRDMCRENHIRLTYLIVPSKIQIEPEDMRPAFERIQKYDPSITPERVRALTDMFAAETMKAAAELGVEVIDPQPGMLAHKAGRRLYYLDDMHMNVEGNRVLGEVAADLLLASQHHAIAAGNFFMRTLSTP